MSIDPSDFIEAPEGQKSLKFGDEKQEARFELGVCMAIYRWEELDTAVVNSWGGPNSNEKRDWISGIVIDLFEDRIVDVQLIEETLLYAMVDEFDTHVDNDSALEIGALIIKIYREAALKTFDQIDSLYERWSIKQQNRQQQKVQFDNSDGDDDDDDDDQDMGNDTSANNNDDGDDGMQVDNGPVVDDDGFTLVQNKKGNKR